MPKSRDLFDDTTMTFGEHLEVLRMHVLRALVGVIITVTVAFFFGDRLFLWLRSPIETALREAGIREDQLIMDVPKQSMLEYIKSFFRESPASAPEPMTASETLKPDQLRVQVSAAELRRALNLPATTPLENTNDPGSGATDSATENVRPPEQLSLVLQAPEFAQLQRVLSNSNKLVTLKVEEGFMGYMKVCFFAGLLAASPWVFYQLWLFVAAGLYPHERRYVHVYLPMSIVLFVAGAAAGYFYAFPLMLDFLIDFNKWLGFVLQPRLSDYITMAMLLPLLFGVSFQLPLVMVFLERIGICTVQTYKDNWRIAVLIISIASMVLTTSPDPWSMMLMMVPLLILYVLGIWLCGFRLSGSASPIR
jgi:sec-independent protein translocase protein TatC